MPKKIKAKNFKPQAVTIEVDQFTRPTFLFILITFGMVPVEFLKALLTLQLPVNATQDLALYKGYEIGVARNAAVEDALARTEPPKYLLWLSDDDLPAWDALIKLWVEMEESWRFGPGWDIISSLVHLKQDYPEPVLWNKALRADGPLLPGQHYVPGDVVQADVANLGFGLMRMDVFQRYKLDKPYFHSGFTARTTNMGKEVVSKHTEDCFFFEALRAKGGRIGVHTGVRSGHIDVKSGVVY